MKKLCLLLSALLLLTGCAGRQTDAPKTSGANADIPLSSEEQPPITTAAQKVSIPDVPAVQNPEPATQEPTVQEPVRTNLPDLPLPVYCYEDTAVASDGTILLQLPEQQLDVLTDSVSGEPRGILAHDAQAAALYDLSGNLLLENLYSVSFHCTGDLFWYGGHGDITLIRTSDKQILQENLSTVCTAGSHIFVQPAYWNSSCIIMDSAGNEVRTLDRGFQLGFSYHDVSGDYVIMQARDGTEMLVDKDGLPCLPDFCYQVLSISQGCAVILQGQEYQLVDLSTQMILFRYDRPFSWLGGTVLTVGQDDTLTLMDLQGKVLLEAMTGTIADPDGNGVPDYLVCSVLDGNSFLTQIYATDGTLLQTLDCSFYNVTPLTDTLLLQTKPYGAGQKQQGWLVDLQNGTETKLLSGTYLNAQPVFTSDGLFLLIGSEEQYVLMRPDRTEFFRCERCTYVGGDVFRCTKDGQEGLMTLNGSWLLTRP